MNQEVFEKSSYYEDRNYSGTESYHRITLSRRVLFSDGALATAELKSCFWFMEMIASYSNKFVGHDFMIAFFMKDDRGPKGEFFLTDGNYNIIARQQVLFTDIDCNLKLYVTPIDEDHYLVFLPSEY